MCTKYMQYLQRPEDYTGSARTGVTVSHSVGAINQVFTRSPQASVIFINAWGNFINTGLTAKDLHLHRHYV